MEGPSLFLAAEQLATFTKKIILKVKGNTQKIEKERLSKKKVLSIFSWGKHLVFQFDEFALRVHFLLFGSFEATVNGKKVTGDYRKKNRTPRLQLTFKNGKINLYSCSLKYLETADAKETYDPSIDIMSPEWNSKKALENFHKYRKTELGDLLLDQTLFAGVGNIIKNEVLFLIKKAPDQLLNELSLAQQKKLIKTTRDFSHQFYEWRKRFVLRKHYQIYRKGTCPTCKGKVIRKKTGKRMRLSFYCSHCQR